MSANDAAEPAGAAARLKAGPSAADAGMSPAYHAYLRGVQRRRRAVLVTQIALLIGFLILWEVAPRMEWVNPMLTSYPSAIWPTFTSMMAEGDLLYHTWVTVEETVIGFAIALALGLVVAVALWWSEFLYRVLDPYLVVGNAMPKIALVPIFYIWLGEKASIYGIAVAIGVFITILMIFNGFQETDPNKIKLVRTFGGNKWQIFRKVVLPGSVPTIIAALKINIGLALVGVIVGEFQSAKAGLGYLIVYGSQVFQMHLVMTAIAVLVVISTIMYVAILLFERRVLRYR